MRSVKSNGEHFKPTATPAFHTADLHKPCLGWNRPTSGVVMLSQSQILMGTTGLLSTANWLQMKFNTGVCEAVIWVGIVPRCCKMSLSPSQAAGGFQNSLPLAGKCLWRAAKAQDIHSHLIALHEPGSLPGLQVLEQICCRKAVQSPIRQLIRECL